MKEKDQALEDRIVELSRLNETLTHQLESQSTLLRQQGASSVLLSELIDNVPALLAYVDAEQCCRFHNKAYRETFGLSADQLNGRTMRDLMGEEYYEFLRPKVEEVLSGYPVTYEREQKVARGGHRYYMVNYFPRYGDGAKRDEVIGFYSLGTDITELKRIDTLKSEFVSTVSHELRTPLTSIRGSLGLVTGGMAGVLPDTAKTLITIAKNNCERLIRLINDILDIEKLESGHMRMELQPLELRSLLDQAVAANQGYAIACNVKLVLNCDEGPWVVKVDPDRLTQVVTNLLSNAIKFSPQDGAVTVHVKRAESGVRVEVQDNGPGIAEEFRSRIFQKFSQADSSDARQKGGTGLGLNISRAIVEKLGGSIGFDTKLGAGSTFFFELPLHDDSATVAGFQLRAAPPPPRSRILICDGDRDVARLISMMLDKAGFDSDISHDVEQAFALLERGRYDAITLDLKLPGQKRGDFINTLRDNEKTRDLPVVVISALAGEGQLQFSHKPSSVMEWLTKPIDENRLVASMQRAVAELRGSKPRILHVEDDPDIQHITSAIAGDLATFEFANTLAQARACLQTKTFDLVLLDLTLGHESGWDLVELIDALQPRPSLIVFSASEVLPRSRVRPDAMLVKASTSNTDLLNTIQRVLQLSANPSPSAQLKP